MAELVKTEAVVLKKIDFGDSSKIATLLTPDFGKISVIIKGARSGKSKIGTLVDTLNHVEVVFYEKKSREIQLISQADLLNNFTHIKDNLEKLQYASAVLELVSLLTVEQHDYRRLFRGITKILGLINNPESKPKFLFVRFFLFLLEELGYEFQFDNCTFCGKELKEDGKVKFNYEFGMMCTNCSAERVYSFEFSQELFNSLMCLSQRELKDEINLKEVDKLIYFLERYLMYHISEFKGLKSLQMF